MNKTVLISLLTLGMLAGPASALTIGGSVDAEGQTYDALYTGSNWMILRVPSSALGGRTPTALRVGGLPAGVSIALTGVSTWDRDTQLAVSVTREDSSTFVYATATVEVLDGEDVLTTLQVDVIGAPIVSDVT